MLHNRVKIFNVTILYLHIFKMMTFMQIFTTLETDRRMFVQEASTRLEDVYVRGGRRRRLQGQARPPWMVVVQSPLHWGYLLLLWLQVVFIVTLFPLFLKPIYCSWFCFILVFFTLAYKEIELYMNFHTSYVSWFSLFLLSVSLAPSPTVHSFFFKIIYFILCELVFCLHICPWLNHFF